MKCGLRQVLAAVLLALVSSPAPAGEQAAHKLLTIDGHAVRWEQGAGAVVTYRFLREGIVSGERNCRAMGPIDAVLTASGIPETTLRRAAQRAFERWSSVANIRFEETVNEADIVIGASGRDRGVAFADVSLAPVDGAFAPLTRALICLNPHETWNAVTDGDKATREVTYVLTHEIGHAIGLDHPGRRGALMAFGYDETADTLTAGDIRAARLLYGIAPMPVTSVSSAR